MLMNNIFKLNFTFSEIYKYLKKYIVPFCKATSCIFVMVGKRHHNENIWLKVSYGSE